MITIKMITKRRYYLHTLGLTNGQFQLSGKEACLSECTLGWAEKSFEKRGFKSWQTAQKQVLK